MMVRYKLVLETWRWKETRGSSHPLGDCTRITDCRGFSFLFVTPPSSSNADFPHPLSIIFDGRKNIGEIKICFMAGYSRMNMGKFLRSFRFKENDKPESAQFTQQPKVCFLAVARCELASEKFSLHG